MSNTLIKNLSNENPTIAQLAFAYVFGGKAPEMYDPDKTYQKGDVIIKYDPITNTYVIYKAGETIQPGSTFDPSQWEEKNNDDVLTDASSFVHSIVMDYTTRLLQLMSGMIEKEAIVDFFDTIEYNNASEYIVISGCKDGEQIYL